MSCEFAHDDGPYVLGSLSPAERSAYQEHLAGCASCTRSVQQLAGLPGLLSRAPAGVLESPPTPAVPGTLLPALVAEASRDRRRSTRRVLCAAAAAVVVVAGGSLAVGLSVGGDDGPGSSAPSAIPSPSGSPSTSGEAMAPVGPEVMSADLAMTSVSWGTRLDLSCSYPQGAAAYDEPRRWTYALLVRTRDGREERVASWEAAPGESMRLSAATATPREQIVSVEILGPDGEALLRTAA